MRRPNLSNSRWKGQVEAIHRDNHLALLPQGKGLEKLAAKTTKTTQLKQLLHDQVDLNAKIAHARLETQKPKTTPQKGK